MTNEDWVNEKEALLTEFNQWLSGWTKADPYPADLIDQMLEIKPYIQMANHAEFIELNEWWQAVKTAACNGGPLPAQ